MATLAQRADELKTRRNELAALFEKHRNTSGEYDMPPDVLAEVRGRNEDLDRLGREFADLQSLEAAERHNAEEIDRLAAPSARVPHGGASGRGGEGVRGRWEGFSVAPSPALPVAHLQRSLGDLFIESRAYREFKGGQSPIASLPDVDLKTLFSTTAGWAPQILRTGYVLMSPQQQPKVVDLIPKTETTQAGVRYMEETTFTGAAAETAEGGTYPESALTLTEKTSTVRKIATFIPVTDEQFEDEPQARDYVNNRLAFMLEQKLDSELLTGDGVAPDLLGLLNVSGINTQARGTDPATDAIYKAINKIRINGFTEPSGVVMHPTDFQNLRLLRTADGIYIWGNPALDAGPAMIYGLPIVLPT